MGESETPGARPDVRVTTKVHEGAPVIESPNVNARGGWQYYRLGTETTLRTEVQHIGPDGRKRPTTSTREVKVPLTPEEIKAHNQQYGISEEPGTE